MLLFVLLLILMMLQAQQGAKADLSVGAAYKPHQPLGSAALQLRTQVFNCSLLARLTISLKILRMVNKLQLFSLESTAAAERLADYSRDSPLLGRCRSSSLSLSSSSASQTLSSLSKVSSSSSIHPTSKQCNHDSNHLHRYYGVSIVQQHLISKMLAIYEFLCEKLTSLFIWSHHAPNPFFIGPESDHCLPLSLTDWLTNSLTPV